MFKPASKDQLNTAIVKCTQQSGDCSTGPHGPIGDWDVSGVTVMAGVFLNVNRFRGDIGKWDVSSVTNMGYMFNGAKNFNRDISKWNVGKVEYMENMFQDATYFNSDISEWDVGKVKDMASMFYGAKSFNRDISKWNVGKVIDMKKMFFGARSFTQTLCGAWRDSNAYTTDMFHMSRGKIGSAIECTGGHPPIILVRTHANSNVIPEPHP